MATFLFLAVGFFLSFLLVVIKWVYPMRHLIKYSMMGKGPSIWEVSKTIGMNSNINTVYDSILSVCGSYLDLDCAWFGQKLVVMVKSPETLKIVYNSQHTLSRGSLVEYLTGFLGKGLPTASPETWKIHRKLINPTFNPKIIDSFVDIFAEKSMDLVDELQQFDGKGIFNLEFHLTKSMLNLICETAMGLKDLHETTNLEEIGEKIDRMTTITLIRIANIFYHPNWIFVRTKLGKELKQLVTEYNKFIREIVTTKRLQFEEKTNNPEPEFNEISNKRKVFLDYLLEITESDNGNKFTDQELLDEVASFIFAGSDTSAVTLGNLICMMAMHPEIQEKVYQEAVDILGSDRMAVAEDLPRLKYTERVIKESLRLFPATPLAGRRCAEDLVVNDKVTIPKNVELMLCLWEVHTNPEYFPDPFTFDPDRFLPEEANKRHPYAWVPFTGGPRNCIGINYAMKMFKVFVSTLVRKYQFFTEYAKVEDIEVKWTITYKTKHGHKVSLVSRK